MALGAGAATWSLLSAVLLDPLPVGSGRPRDGRGRAYRRCRPAAGDVREPDVLLVRTEARRVEFATCLALGATRAQLARGIIMEGAILTTAAASLSPLVARWLFSAVSTFQLPGGIALGLLDRHLIDELGP